MRASLLSPAHAVSIMYYICSIVDCCLLKMVVLGVLAAVIAALLTAVLFVFVAYTVYLVIVHRRYAHIPQPKGAS